MVDDDLFRQLERELGLLLRRAQASSTSIAKDVHPDLEPSAYALLALIAVTPGVRASDLAATIGVGRGTMSRQLARLGTTGLVARQPDPDDYRGQLLELTDEGKRRFEAAQQARRAYLNRALGAWSEGEVSALATQLGRLNDDLAAFTLAHPAH
ncbi:MarR family winged helix-turn-helix transcriptional regulator [Cellulomonas fengjieae]|uniref:MarR family transcriptional regulator n=1 Tax=Cellulomonas fengjieae TaxID=2819978 RepID=A0ABS3SCC6_9CELL|nr:MarR family transcriptional regulator [Cellulomonas fengjieae]MBO3083393.1 MarR family transcriptional regulator [Cellulomonas fengjieae]MBO3101856.1 MarR family transcriptional regulator [Cellulomonas fengjieae]QVI65268.1 MarR family transcriptional regulator [Cellulomonas fengjieae]